MLKKVLEGLEWLGHDAFRLTWSKVLYFDPYELSGGPLADYILISHDHFDHCSPEDVKKIQGPRTILITEKDSAKKLAGEIRVLKPGDSLDLGDLKVEAVPSYNTGKDFHPRKNGWLGFVVELEGVRIYHPGDSDFIPEMNRIQADIALLPVSGTYVMTAAEAVNAALAIGPKVAIPMHYGAIVGSAKDAEQFRDQLAGKIEVRILPKKA
jgi:L-ascorbate metabolism protein UlaG (beta-lactamase superfamily)